MILALMIRRLSVHLRLWTKPWNLVWYSAYPYLFPSRLSYPSLCRWLALDNAPLPVTDQTSYTLPQWEIKYFSCADITGSMSPSPVFLTGIILRAPTMGKRVFCLSEENMYKSFFFEVQLRKYLCVNSSQYIVNIL